MHTLVTAYIYYAQQLVHSMWILYSQTIFRTHIFVHLTCCVSLWTLLFYWIYVGMYLNLIFKCVYLLSSHIKASSPRIYMTFSTIILCLCAVNVENSIIVNENYIAKRLLGEIYKMQDGCNHQILLYKSIFWFIIIIILQLYTLDKSQVVLNCISFRFFFLWGIIIFTTHCKP